MLYSDTFCRFLLVFSSPLGESLAVCCTTRRRSLSLPKRVSSFHRIMQISTMLPCGSADCEYFGRSAVCRLSHGLGQHETRDIGRLAMSSTRPAAHVYSRCRQRMAWFSDRWEDRRQAKAPVSQSTCLFILHLRFYAERQKAATVTGHACLPNRPQQWFDRASFHMHRPCGRCRLVHRGQPRGSQCHQNRRQSGLSAGSGSVGSTTVGRAGCAWLHRRTAERQGHGSAQKAIWHVVSICVLCSFRILVGPAFVSNMLCHVRILAQSISQAWHNCSSTSAQRAYLTRVETRPCKKTSRALCDRLGVLLGARRLPIEDRLSCLCRAAVSGILRCMILLAWSHFLLTSRLQRHRRWRCLMFGDAFGHYQHVLCSFPTWYHFVPHSITTTRTERQDIETYRAVRCRLSSSVRWAAVRQASVSPGHSVCSTLGEMASADAAK